MRCLVRWLSLTFADFDLGGFSGRGLTCAAHMPGASKSAPNITTRRRRRVPNFDILIRSPACPDFLSTPMHEACQWPALADSFAHPRDITGVRAFHAITKFLLNKILIPI